jgi:hypothetical protein
MNQLPMKTLLPAVSLVLFAASTVCAQLNSGPTDGSPVPALRIAVLTGNNADEELDIAKQRGPMPTIYIFIQADKWDRPVARFLRTLDDELRKDRTDVAIIATWLTDDVQATKDYLPNAQQSLQLAQTSLALFPGDKNGPPGWGIHPGAHLTAVIAADSRVVASFGYRSLNETNVPEVLAKLPAAK